MSPRRSQKTTTEVKSESPWPCARAHPMVAPTPAPSRPPTAARHYGFDQELKQHVAAACAPSALRTTDFSCALRYGDQHDRHDADTAHHQGHRGQRDQRQEEVLREVLPEFQEGLLRADLEVRSFWSARSPCRARMMPSTSLCMSSTGTSALARMMIITPSGRAPKSLR